MRLDWELAKRGYRRYAAYPMATAAGAFTNTVFGFPGIEDVVRRIYSGGLTSGDATR